MQPISARSRRNQDLILRDDTVNDLGLKYSGNQNQNGSLSDRTVEKTMWSLPGMAQLQRRLDSTKVENYMQLKSDRSNTSLDQKENIQQKNEKFQKVISSVHNGLTNQSPLLDLGPLELTESEVVPPVDPTTAWELLRRTDWQQMTNSEWLHLRQTFLDLLKSKTEKEEQNVELRGHVERVLQASVEQLSLLEQKVTDQVTTWREEMIKLLEAKDMHIENLQRTEKEYSRQIAQLTAQLRTISASRIRSNPVNGFGFTQVPGSGALWGASINPMPQPVEKGNAKAVPPVPLRKCEDGITSVYKGEDGVKTSLCTRSKTQSPRRNRDRSPRSPRQCSPGNLSQRTSSSSSETRPTRTRTPGRSRAEAPYARPKRVGVAAPPPRATPAQYRNAIGSTSKETVSQEASERGSQGGESPSLLSTPILGTRRPGDALKTQLLRSPNIGLRQLEGSQSRSHSVDTASEVNSQSGTQSVSLSRGCSPFIPVRIPGVQSTGFLHGIQATSPRVLRVHGFSEIVKNG